MCTATLSNTSCCDADWLKTWLNLKEWFEGGALAYLDSGRLVISSWSPMLTCIVLSCGKTLIPSKGRGVGRTLA